MGDARRRNITHLEAEARTQKAFAVAMDGDARRLQPHFDRITRPRASRASRSAGSRLATAAITSAACPKRHHPRARRTGAGKSETEEQPTGS